MRYAAVVLHYRNWPEVMRTLNDLLGQTDSPIVVVVVDHSPDDERLREAVASFANVVYVARENAGYAAGMNAALVILEGLAGWEAVLCLTHEVRMPTDTVRLLLRVLEEVPDAGMVGPLLLRAGTDSTIWSAGGRLHGPRLQAEHDLIGSQREQSAWQMRSCDWLDGAALLLRRSSLAEVGSFDERFFLYWEEVDLAIRFRTRGYKVVCCVMAEAWQRPSGTPLYLGHRNRLILLRKHAGWVAVMLELRFQASELPRAILGAALGRRSLRDVVYRVLGLCDGLTGRLHRRALL